MMSRGINQRDLFRAFKNKGLSLSSDANSYLLRVLLNEEEPKEALEKVLDEIQNRIEKQEIKSGVIDGDVVTNVIADLTSNDEDIKQNCIQLLDAFHTPKIEFDERQKTYKLNLKPTTQLFGTVESRGAMFRERLLLTQQRLFRSGLFVPRGISSALSNAKKGAYEISPIASLLGYRGGTVLFGMITQPEECRWYLEDMTGSILLDLSSCKFESALVTEGSNVIVQGALINSVYVVEAMMLPPAESRSDTLAAMNIDDTLGSGYRSAQLAQMQELEAEAVDQLFVFMSDVQLDNPLVLEKLQQVFQGFELTGTSPLFILMGSFVSKPVMSLGGREAHEAAYNNLADVICSCPIIAKTSKFLLLPGPKDSDFCPAFPRRPMPARFTAELSRRVANVTIATNPCRLRFYTQEIVMFREDLLKKLQRSSITPATSAQSSIFGSSQEGGAIAEELIKTIIQQAHLSPVPLHATPIFWELDHVFRLTPLPHLLILAGRQEQFSYESAGCLVVNPGSFVSDYSFVVYRPATREIEFSQLK